MFDKAHDSHNSKDYKGKDTGHGDMAGKGKGTGDHAKQVAEQDNHEKCKYEGEITHTLFADIVTNHAGNEFVKTFGNQLTACRDNGLFAHGEGQKGKGQNNADGHPQGGIGEGQVYTPDREGDEGLYFKLVNRVRHGLCSLSNWIRFARVF